MLKTVKERVDTIADNSNLSVNTSPTTCKLELTGMCTLNCKFCNHDYMKKCNDRQHFLTDDDFELALSYIQSLETIKEIGLFYMGESAMHPHIATYYQRIKSLDYFTFLTTNGTLINNIIPAIPYIDSLKVSFNYVDEADFVKKTRREASLYNTVLKNISVLATECHKYRKELTVSTVLDTQREYYHDAISLLKSIGADQHYFIPLQNQGGTQDDGADGVVGQADNMVKPLPCWSLFKGLYIDCDLNVRTCCYGHSKEHILGDIHNLQTIKSKKNVMSMQLKHQIPDICKNCLRKERC